MGVVQADDQAPGERSGGGWRAVLVARPDGRWGRGRRGRQDRRGQRPRRDRAARRGGRALVPGVLLAVGLAASACGGPAGSRSAPSGAGTVAGTAAAASPLRTTPLTLDELRARKGHLGFDVRDQPFLDPEHFDLAKLRLACGGTAALPFAGSGEHEVFRSSLAVVVEALAGGLARPETVVEAARADLRPGCAPVATRWSGQPVTATYAGPVELAGPGEVVAWSEDWVTASGGERHRYVVLAGAGDRLTVVDLVVDIRLEPAQVRSLFEAAIVP